jgi:hypothetical protein
LVAGIYHQGGMGIRYVYPKVIKLITDKLGHVMDTDLKWQGVMGRGFCTRRAVVALERHSSFSGAGPALPTFGKTTPSTILLDALDAARRDVAASTPPSQEEVIRRVLARLVSKVVAEAHAEAAVVAKALVVEAKAAKAAKAKALVGVEAKAEAKAEAEAKAKEKALLAKAEAKAKAKAKAAEMLARVLAMTDPCRDAAKARGDRRFV